MKEKYLSTCKKKLWQASYFRPKSFPFCSSVYSPFTARKQSKKKMTSRRKCLFWFLAREERETTVVERCGGKSTPAVAAEAESSVPHWAGSREQRRCCSVHLILIQSRTPAHAMVPNIFKGGPPSSIEAFRKHWEFCLLCYHKPKYVDNED